MFCLRTASLNIRRHKQKSILVVLISLLVAFFAFIYLNSIQTSQQEFDSLPQSIPVTARIENLNGSQVVGLEISDNLLGNLRNSVYVKDLYYSVQLAANFTDVPDEKDKPKKIFLRAVNDINAIPNYEDNNIQLKNSVDLDFLKGKDALCIADDIFMQRNDLSVGDDMEMYLYGLVFDPKDNMFSYLPLGKCSLLIVGSMSSGSDGETLMDVLCPAGWAKDKHIAGNTTFHPDAAMFTVADPMKLDAFKVAMKKYYLMPVNPLAEATIYGSALSVKDETFIKTATRLQNNLAVLYTFAPMVFAVIALVGYALSYLLMQTRCVEVVLMRSLGTSRTACVLVMLFEYASLGLLGALLGMICSAVLTGSAGAAPLLAFLLFFVSFVIGTAGAAFQISRRTAMSGFVKVET